MRGNQLRKVGWEGVSDAYPCKTVAVRWTPMQKLGHRVAEILWHVLYGKRDMLHRCRLSVLWNEIMGDFNRFGYWFRDNAGTADKQNGVFRTNCVDTLDRTNVVQVPDHVLCLLAIMTSLPELG